MAIDHNKIAEMCVDVLHSAQSMQKIAADIKSLLPVKDIAGQKKYLRDNIKEPFFNLLATKYHLTIKKFKFKWETLYAHIFGTMEKVLKRKRYYIFFIQQGTFVRELNGIFQGKTSQERKASEFARNTSFTPKG